MQPCCRLHLPAWTCRRYLRQRRNLVVENCRVTGAMGVLTFKLRPDTPQCYEDIHYRDITLDNERGALLAINPWTQYFDLKAQPPPKSVVRHITVSNVKGRFGAFGEIQGSPGQSEISDIRLENIDLQLQSEKLKAVKMKKFKLENINVNGKPYSLNFAE